MMSQKIKKEESKNLNINILSKLGIFDMFILIFYFFFLYPIWQSYFIIFLHSIFQYGIIFSILSFYQLINLSKTQFNQDDFNLEKFQLHLVSKIKRIALLNSIIPILIFILVIKLSELSLKLEILTGIYSKINIATVILSILISYDILSLISKNYLVFNQLSNYKFKLILNIDTKTKVYSIISIVCLTFLILLNAYYQIDLHQINIIIILELIVLLFVEIYLKIKIRKKHKIHAKKMINQIELKPIL
ncbi:MAG: hypothetical protein ACTSWX_09400 [Promethearchaeota archaeon]